MAYRKGSRTGRSSKSGGGYSRSRSTRSRGRRSFTSGRSRTVGRAQSRAVQHTVRIVLEHPASNPMATVPMPVGMQVDTSRPQKAKF